MTEWNLLRMRQPKKISAIHVSITNGYGSYRMIFMLPEPSCSYRLLKSTCCSSLAASAFLISRSPVSSEVTWVTRTLNSIERLMPAIHLGILIGNLVFSVAALYTLYLRSSRINSVLQLFLQPRTGTTYFEMHDRCRSSHLLGSVHLISWWFVNRSRSLCCEVSHSRFSLMHNAAEVCCALNRKPRNEY